MTTRKTGQKSIKVQNIRIGGKAPLCMIAGPCVIESRKACLDLARRLKRIARQADLPFIFKASYDKANRTSIGSYRGPGLTRGLEILAEIRETLDVPVLTDVHSVTEVTHVARVVDVLQIPAFLCRQTDLLVAAAETGRVVNVKKGQFISPWDMEHVIGKIEGAGNRKILLTERGASFGYNNLVADMRSLLVMSQFGYPVIFDATHSVQRPGGAGSSSGGDGQWAPALARAAVATGCNGVFMETHVNPEEALSDKANAVPVTQMRKIMMTLKGIDAVVR
ncbi:MAG: 3-deoxy-8-phosphooctulonate synthase [Kiritimatiellae bacterium]|nr:3-deoxy-8-phosphooctulonate synthase [Kiritimatiellia bacterium]